MNGPGPEIVGSASASKLDAKWERRAEELEFESLSKIRGAAEKWTATLAALLGLASTVLIVKGADEISKLPHVAQVAIAILVGLAFVVAVAATTLAATAAQGTPRILKRPSGAALRQSERESAEIAKSRLSSSRRLTLLAVVLLALGVAVAWFWPVPRAAGSNVLFAPSDGRPVCGALVNEDRGLAIEIGERSTVLPTGPYDDIVPVESCPAK